MSRSELGGGWKLFSVDVCVCTISRLTLPRNQVLADIVRFLKIKIKILLTKIGGCC